MGVSNVGYDPALQNVVVWVNPVAGDAGAQIGDTYQGDFYREGCATFRVDPEHPNQLLTGSGPRPIADWLHMNPYGNAFFLNTVADREKRQSALLTLLNTIHYERNAGEAQPPVLLVSGGDGTSAEAEEAAATVVGLPPRVLFEDSLGRTETKARLAKAPRMAIPRPAGTACDLTLHLGPMKAGENVVCYLRDCHEAHLPLSVSSFSGDTYQLTPHTVSFGSVAYLFERAEVTKHNPLFKGSTLNYAKEAPGLLLGKVVAAIARSPELFGQIQTARKNPVDPFWAHYCVNGESAVSVYTGDFLATGLLFIAKGIHNPNPFNDGVVVYFMPAMTPHLLLTLMESAIRGRWMMMRHAEQSAWVPGRKFFTLPQERRVHLSPGDLLEVNFTQDQKGEIPREPPCQINGGPMGNFQKVSIRVTDPYPVLTRSGSLSDQWNQSSHNLGI